MVLVARRSSGVLAGLLLLAGSPYRVSSQQGIPFDSPRWTHVNTTLTEVAGRQGLQGTAVLEDVDFRDGLIEFDLFLTGARSYPGVYFRMDASDNAEHVYVRPHRAGLYPDAVQYSPVVRGIGEWQLHNGPGYTAAGSFTEDAWIPVRVEVQGTQARVFVEDLSTPALEVPYLEGPATRGGLALAGPTDGSAYFSNFRYDAEAEVTLDPAPARVMPEGAMRTWEVSQAIPPERVRRGSYPDDFALFRTDWQTVEADVRGLVDIADRTARQNQEGDLVLARHVFQSPEDRNLDLDLGYSDEIDLFFNGRRVFSGRSRYQGRDPSFLGVLGLHDQVPVRARKGLNEVLVMVTEYFGGWGFMIQGVGAEPAATDHGAIEEVWETGEVFLTPESVLEDPARDVLYVSSFDAGFAQKPEPSGFISRVSPDGEVLDLRWVEGLNAPAGMATWRDTLFVAERAHLVSIDLATGTVAKRREIPGAVFPNDVAVDGSGTVYISDTRPGNPEDSRIIRFRDGVFDIFVEHGINRANALWIEGGWLYVGNSGDGMLKRVELATGRTEDVVSLGAGIIDGIRRGRDGDLLVSHWAGRIYRITPAGVVTRILDAESRGWNTADIEYIADEGLVIIPTFFDNRVRAVRVAR